MVAHKSKIKFISMNADRRIATNSRVSGKEAAAIREENTYSKKGYLTHIMKVPPEQSRDVCWKYALYVRATQTAVGRVIKRGN